MKKKIIAGALSIFLAVIVLCSFYAPPPPPPGDITEYENDAPIAEQMFVQKLEDTLSDGSNMIIRIKYHTDNASMPSSMRIYYSDNDYIVFSDDGTYPDSTSGDKNYAAYVKEDIPAMISLINSSISDLTTAGHYLRFTAHLGEDRTTIPDFDQTSFDAFAQVPLDGDVFNQIICTGIAKEKSLFITDLSVVENSSRTYNAYAHTGTAMDVWTFGYMMKNMAGSTVNPVDFAKSWVQQWMASQIVNGQTVDDRNTFALKFLIRPWLLNAGYVEAGHDPVDKTHWESIWDSFKGSGTTEDNLLAAAPFKLTAIVNRLDLRGNSSYAQSVTNAGETRFIFTLESVYDDGKHSTGGKYDFWGSHPAQNSDQDGGISIPNYLDWLGMNVIFEYGNVQTTRCDVKDFATQWYNLSNYSFPSSALNTALASITNTVTALNAATGKPNGSAINRIRTNERIFFETIGNTSSWNNSNWEFRQFEINASSHLLKLVPLTNTPNDTANYSETLINDNTSLHFYHDWATTDKVDNLLDWVFYSNVNKLKLMRGVHVLPLTYPTSIDYMLAGSAQYMENMRII